MDGSQKRVALIAEVTRGTTPTTPAFLTVRDIRTTGGKQQPRMRSPERSATRQSLTTYKGLVTIPKQIEMPLAYDDALNVLLASVLQTAWASNVAKLQSTVAGMTLEEFIEGGATDFYRRSLGFFAESLQLSCSNGQPGMLTIGGRALTQATDTAILAGATYVDPNPGGPPMTPGDFVLNTTLGLTTPKIQALNLSIRNNAYDLHGFGSDDPYDQGLGQADVEGSVELYFRTAAEYTTFVGAGSLGAVLDITMGSVTLNKYRLKLTNLDCFNPDIGDPGPSGPVTCTIPFVGNYKASDSSAITLTRAVA